MEEETSRLPRLVWVTWVRLLDPWENAQPRLARWRLVAADGGQSAPRGAPRLGLFGHGRIGAVALAASRLCILQKSAHQIWIGRELKTAATNNWNS